MRLTRRSALVGGLAGAPALRTRARAFRPERPVALYASRRLLPTATGPDITLQRAQDMTIRAFDFDAHGRRDSAAIRRFLNNSAGRVIAVTDQTGHFPLHPPDGTLGPLLCPEVTTQGLPGLLFDNSGAFQGNPPALHQPYHATALMAQGPGAACRDGVTIIAALRLGNVVSIAGGALWSVETGGQSAMVVRAGSLGPGYPLRQACDLSVLNAAGSVDLALAPPSTPSVIGLGLDRTGRSVLARNTMRRGPPIPLPLAGWADLLLGTRIAGAGSGWQLDAVALFDHRLPDDAMQEWSARLGGRLPVPRRGTLVLDGSSVEAGMGSTCLQNETRLYEAAFPGWEINNVAVGGASIADRLAALPATLRFLRNGAGVRVLLSGAGANTLAVGVAPDVAYAQSRAYIRDARAAVPGIRIGLTTIIPNRVGLLLGRGAAFAAYNRLVRANGAGADFIADRASDTIMGDPGRYEPIDPRISLDGGHPTAFGHRRLAAIDCAAIRTVL